MDAIIIMIIIIIIIIIKKTISQLLWANMTCLTKRGKLSVQVPLHETLQLAHSILWGCANILMNMFVTDCLFQNKMTIKRKMIKAFYPWNILGSTFVEYWEDEQTDTMVFVSFNHRYGQGW